MSREHQRAGWRQSPALGHTSTTVRGLTPNDTYFRLVTRRVSEGNAGKSRCRSPSLTLRVAKVSAIGLTPTGSPALKWLAALAVCATCSGCEVGRQHFQMNSNSPTPFFGIDLLPRRKTTSIVSPPTGQQLASADAVAGEIETAAETPARRRFWQRNAKSVDSAPATIILPLSKPKLDQPIYRGPVELLP